MDQQTSSFALFICLLIFISLLLFLKRASKKQSKWGINTKPVNCPECESELPYIRKPKNMRQLLWGGATCESCEVEVDKWGKKIN